MNQRVAFLGAMIASAALTTRLSAASEVAAAPARMRYDEAMADVIARRRAPLPFPPSWELALEAWREGAAAQDRPAHRFDIAPGTLAEVLAAFERATGLAVRFADEGLKDIKSGGASGVLAPETALDRLLQGTGAEFELSAAGGVLIKIGGVRESVAVTGVRTVSSPKLPQPLRDIPQTITVIQKEVMQAQGAT